MASTLSMSAASSPLLSNNTRWGATRSTNNKLVAPPCMVRFRARRGCRMPVLRAEAVARDHNKDGSTAVDLHVNQGNQSGGRSRSSGERSRPRRLAADVSPFGMLFFFFFSLLLLLIKI
ncbi:hypothetical protein ACOSP7_023182 [Xanthoceras sorbifolium]